MLRRDGNQRVAELEFIRNLGSGTAATGYCRGRDRSDAKFGESYLFRKPPVLHASEIRELSAEQSWRNPE